MEHTFKDYSTTPPSQRNTKDKGLGHWFIWKTGLREKDWGREPRKKMGKQQGANTFPFIKLGQY